jgi:large subunit ribosomal protein L32e
MVDDKKSKSEEKKVTKSATKSKPIAEKKTTKKITTTKKTVAKEELASKKKTTTNKPKTEKKIEKPKPKTDTKKTEEKPKKEEEIEDKEEKVEEPKYKVKKKPEITKELKTKLQIRRQIKKRTPEFLREEWFRYKRISKNWRHPDGITSKMRINLKYRPSKVRVGFRGPQETRGLHSSGFEEVIVYNVSDLEDINPKTQAARIGGSVGTKKRINIEKKAEELDIRLLNL